MGCTSWKGDETEETSDACVRQSADVASERHCTTNKSQHMELWKLLYFVHYIIK